MSQNWCFWKNLNQKSLSSLTICTVSTVVEFLSYVNLHFHFTLMQKFKFWYQLEDNSIRNNFGPSVQCAFHMGVRGPPGGHDPTMHTETAVFSEPITLS